VLPVVVVVVVMVVVLLVAVVAVSQVQYLMQSLPNAQWVMAALTAPTAALTAAAVLEVSLLCVHLLLCGRPTLQATWCMLCLAVRHWGTGVSSPPATLTHQPQ
jgi:hypothetical protein